MPKGHSSAYDGATKRKVKIRKGRTGKSKTVKVKSRGNKRGY